MFPSASNEATNDPVFRVSGPSAMHLLDKGRAMEFVRQHRSLFDAAGAENPFAGSAWMLHFIAHMAGDDLSFAVPHLVGDGESLMLLYSRRDSPHRLALANCYTSLCAPLISSARDRVAAAAALVDQLTRQRPACATIRLAPLDGDGPDTAALARAFAERGWYVRRYFCFGNWHLPCGGLSFETYMAARDPRLYNTWRRKARRFGPAAGGRARLEIVTGGSGVEAAMDAYERVYARSWKRRESSSDFVRGWARVCARNGWLRLGLAWVGEVPVATQFWFTVNGRAHIFKLAYDEAYARWSAGTVLTAHLLKHSLEEDRVAEIDYLSGDDAYKRSWMSARRERIGLVACNPRTWRGLARSARELAGEAAPWCRRLLGAGGRP